MPAAQTQMSNFSTELRRLAEALWNKKDPVETNLTWYALKEGFAYADSQRQEVKRFNEILGETGWVANAIAFGKDRVWVGTNKGLLAWDRKNHFWSRFAVGGTLVDVPVKELSLTQAEILKVVVEEQGKPASTYEYDAQAAKWTELSAR